MDLKGSWEACKGLEEGKEVKMMLIQYTQVKLKVINLI